MSFEPRSVHNSQFTSLGTFNYNKVLSDDYCHKKLGTIKVKATSAKNLSFNLKTNLLLKKVDEKENAHSKLALSDEYKFGFPYERFYLQTRIKRNGEVKMHLDGGDVELLGKKLNLFTNVKTNLSLANYNFRVGCNYFGEKCESNVRVEKNKGEHDFANRTILRQGNWRYGLVTILHLDNTSLKKYDSFVEYKKNDFEYHLSHISPAVHLDGLKLGKCVGGLLYHFNPETKLGFQIKKNFSFPKLRAVLGVQSNQKNGVTLRAKVDSNMKISTVTKYKVNPRLSLSVGAQFNLSKGSKFIDLNKTLPLPLGFGVDIEA